MREIVSLTPSLPRESRRQHTARLLSEAAGAEGGERRLLLDEVVRVNMPLARDLARRYQHRGVDSADLEQVAYVGLVKAARGFDPAKASDFLSFAVPTIRGELRRHFRDHGWVVRPPRSIQELQARITEAEGDLYQAMGRAARPSELAAHLGVDEHAVVEALAANGCFTPTSLDTSVNGVEGEGGLADRLGGPDPAFATAEVRALLGPMIRSLSERERLVLAQAYALEKEVGEE